MTLLTFTPSIAPSPNGASNPEISLSEADFGDGYTQSSPSGLNHIRQVVSLKWDGITLEQKHELDAFFEQHGGYIPFLYQPYGFTSAFRWTCKQWGSTTGTPIGFTATLRQDFSLSP